MLIDRVGGSILTSDSSIAILASYAKLPPNCCVQVIANIVGRDVNTGDLVIYRLSVAIKRLDSDYLIVGAVNELSVTKDASLNDASATIVVDGASFLIQVIGINGDLEWENDASIWVNYSQEEKS